MNIKIPPLKIGHLTARIPIIQGGMGVGISLSGLASAVANEGGVGVISSVGLGGLYSNNWRELRKRNLEKLREEIKIARKKSNGIIGVNIMAALTDFNEMAVLAINEGVDVIFIGAGLPLSPPDNVSIEDLQRVHTKIIPIVSSARAAKIIFSTWDKRYQYVPDGVVVEGPKAGGHLGFKREQIMDPQYKLEILIPQVVSEIQHYQDKYSKNIPVIAAGGIYSGDDIFKFFKLGAQGIQMGTRFVATNECDASKEFKKAYIEAEESDIGIIDSPVGLPGRAIIGEFLRKVSQGLEKPVSCHWKCLKTCNIKQVSYCIGKALVNAQKGLLQKGFAFAGANVYKIKKIISVHDLIKELMEDFLQACRQNAINFS